MHELTNKYVSDLQLTLQYYRGNHFYKGFLIKSFPHKQIETNSDIKPSNEELLSFYQTIQNRADEDDEDQRAVQVIQLAVQKGGSAIYAKGDKISVIRGDLNGLKGNVSSVEDNKVFFFATGIPSLAKKQLEVDIDMVAKYFEPGDFVRILEGKYKGETGQVIDIEDGKLSMLLESSQQEIKIYTNHLKLKSDTDTQHISSIGSKGQTFKANDLVNFNSGKNFGLVLQVNEEQVKVIDHQGK